MSSNVDKKARKTGRKKAQRKRTLHNRERDRQPSSLFPRLRQNAQQEKPGAPQEIESLFTGAPSS